MRQKKLQQGRDTTMSPGPEDLLISFPRGSLQARLVRREKRFRVEVETHDGPFWVHCNNSGSMLGLLKAGSPVLVSPAPARGRTLAYTLELIQVAGLWVGVNTLVPNRILRLAWEAGLLPEIRGYESFRNEVGTGGSRLDARLEGPAGTAWIEAKNVTLVEDGVAYFPDAVTVRGRKHLRELCSLARSGNRCACFYLVQRQDARCFSPADFIDPSFAEIFREALEAGVEVWPHTARVSPAGIGLGSRLPLVAG
ncbi:MAG: DNA/RNA nuclease SfsA [Syntrophobacteraceae bacterium]|nr:DNA/RNA nuclease SfsA [Syntrophobacteraceae bacterium]